MESNHSAWCNLSTITSNSTAASLTSKNAFCNVLYTFYYLVIFARLIASIGLLFNFFNIVVFLHPQLRTSHAKDSNMNSYLLVKCFCDTLFLARNLVISFLECSNCAAQLFRLTQILRLVFIYYICFIVQLGTMLFEVLATFDRFVIVTRKFAAFLKLNFWAVAGAALGFCFAFYSYKLFAIHVVVVNSTTSSHRVTYDLDYSDFGLSVGNAILGQIHSVIRDLVCVLVILVLNLLMFVDMRKAMNKKRAISARSSPWSSAPKKHVYSRADRAEFKLTIMIILTGITAILGHFLTLFEYMFNFATIAESTCQAVLRNVLLEVSCSINFLFYFFFNTKFNRTFLLVFASFGLKLRSTQEVTRSPSTSKETVI